MSESQESPRLDQSQADTPPKEPSAWLRLPFLILFVIVFELAKAVVYLTTVVQFLLRLFTRRPNERLQDLGAALGRYLREVVGFLTQETDDMPFPFGPWPRE